MKKKTWIKIKRGLIEDPKHREKLGIRIWLYFHILDRPDWTTGIISDWQDSVEAKVLKMDVETVRKQRRQLEADGYITCQRRGNRQCIVIHRWVNPREYSGEVYNTPDAGVLDEVSDSAKVLPTLTTPDSTESGQLRPLRSGQLCATLPLDSHLRDSHITPARKERARDAMFDAIVEVTRTDPTIRGNGATIGKVKAELLAAKPPYTPEEVREFGRLWFADGWRKEPPTLWKLRELIGRVRVRPPAPQSVEGIEVDSEGYRVLRE